MRELFPFDHVVHLPDELPQDLRRSIRTSGRSWKTALERVLPAPPDLALRLRRLRRDARASVLGARFVQVDANGAPSCPSAARRSAPSRSVTGQHLPRCVRPHFVKPHQRLRPRVDRKDDAGSRSRRRLRHRLGAGVGARRAGAPRRHVTQRSPGDDVVRGQVACEDALARDANRLLVCDTDPLATAIWAEVLGASWKPRCRRRRRAIATLRPHPCSLRPTSPGSTDSGAFSSPDDGRRLLRPLRG